MLTPSPLSENLPMALLGIQTALNEDLHCTANELVYGTTLRLPGEFFSSTGLTDNPDPASYMYVAKLKTSMQQLQASSIGTQPQWKTYISKDLVTSMHVFVHHDAVRTPLQLLYYDPYRVLKRAEKHHTLEVANRHEVV